MFHLSTWPRCILESECNVSYANCWHVKESDKQNSQNLIGSQPNGWLVRESDIQSSQNLLGSQPTTIINLVDTKIEEACACRVCLGAN